MNIVHFSDTHGRIPAISPKIKVDLLVLSGDLCDNYEQNIVPGIKHGEGFAPTSWKGFWNFREINVAGEAFMQNEWMETVVVPYLAKLGIPKEDVIALKGNHDFGSFEKFFPNSLDRGAKTITVKGIKIGLLTGVPPIAGEWNDEIEEEEFAKRIKTIDPDIEMLVTHVPPYGIQDLAYTHGGVRIGSREVANAIFGKHSGETPYFHKLKLHCFGHAHSAHKVVTHAIDGRIVKFSNAAECRHELDFSQGV